MKIINANDKKPDNEPTKYGVWKAICRYPYNGPDKDDFCLDEFLFIGQRQDYKFLRCGHYHQFSECEPMLEYQGAG